MNKFLCILWLSLPVSFAWPDTAAEDHHPFYDHMYFAGGTFEDPKDPSCRKGFMGWVQYSKDNPPVLIFIDDVFRNIDAQCSPEDLTSSEKSCLRKNAIKRHHKLNGKTYKVTLRLTSKDPKNPTLTLQRHTDSKLTANCNYIKVR